MAMKMGLLRERKVGSIRLLRWWEGMSTKQEDWPQTTRDRPFVLQKGGGEDDE